MRIERIYTRGADRGETSLGDGTRAPKYHLRVRALGGIEEANAAIGVALLNGSRNTDSRHGASALVETAVSPRAVYTIIGGLFRYQFSRSAVRVRIAALVTATRPVMQ